MVQLKTVLAYLATLPLAVFLAFVAEFGAISLVNVLPRPLIRAVGLVVNIVPAFAAGAFVYFVLARTLHGKGMRLPGVSGHLLGTATLWLFFLLLLGFNVHMLSLPEQETGYGLVAQLFIWPMFAALGGITGDILSRRMYTVVTPE